MHACTAQRIRWDMVLGLKGQGRRAHVVLEGMGSGIVLSCSTHACTRVGEARQGGMVCDVSGCVVWQLAGSTPLCIATWQGHVDCVQALLSGGAAINQAMVGSARSMNLPCARCVGLFGALGIDFD
jgi:hypothetical protein